MWWRGARLICDIIIEFLSELHRLFQKLWLPYVFWYWVCACYFIFRIFKFSWLRQNQQDVVRDSKSAKWNFTGQPTGLRIAEPGFSYILKKEKEKEKRDEHMGMELLIWANSMAHCISIHGGREGTTNLCVRVHCTPRFMHDTVCLWRSRQKLKHLLI